MVYSCYTLVDYFIYIQFLPLPQDYYYYYYRYSALGPVWAETRAQSGDWYGSGTLHPGQVLRGSLPLLSPTPGLLIKIYNCALWQAHMSITGLFMFIYWFYMCWKIQNMKVSCIWMMRANFHNICHYNSSTL